MIDADALIVHLNPLQEALQSDGDRDWRGVLAAIAQVVAALPVPVVIKEVGAGLSAPVAQRLAEVGVTMLDVAGAGGTSWAAVEGERAATPQARAVAMAFADGGITDGIDAAKALRLGADLVGQAAAVLGSATASTEAVTAHFQTIIDQLRVVCFCTGSANLTALKAAPLLSAEATA
jgi:isopentenyl-diphosphate delta-isomerase